MSHTSHLREPQGAYKAVKWAWDHYIKPKLQDGQRLTLEIRHESKTRLQEKRYHAMIADIARQAQHLGASWSADDWKRLLVDKFARETSRTHGQIIPNLDKSGVVEVGVQTRKFTRADASEFVEWLFAWGAENGIDWADYRGWIDVDSREIDGADSHSTKAISYAQRVDPATGEIMGAA